MSDFEPLGISCYSAASVVADAICGGLGYGIGDG